MRLSEERQTCATPGGKSGILCAPLRTLRLVAQKGFLWKGILQRESLRPSKQNSHFALRTSHITLRTSYIVHLTFFLLLSGCGIYSFNGASIDYVTTKTISVTNFFNDTAGGPPNMGQFFTEELRDYFQRNTKLELVQKKGDLQFEGAISDYDVRPQSVSSSGNRNQNDQTGLMRLNISVEVTFTNTKKEAESFNRTFSFFADYDPSSTTLTAVEDDLVEEIFDQIIFDIFQASVAQW